LQSYARAGSFGTLDNFAGYEIFGIILLVVGFLWIGWDTAFGFTEDQYVIWISQSQHLPAGDTVKRTDAISAMRDLSLNLKDRHRVVFIPAVLMLAGGLIAAFCRPRGRAANKSLHTAAPAPASSTIL